MDMVIYELVIVLLTAGVILMLVCYIRKSDRQVAEIQAAQTIGLSACVRWEPKPYKVKPLGAEKAVVVWLLWFERQTEVSYSEVITFVQGLGRFATWPELKALNDAHILPQCKEVEDRYVSAFCVVIHHEDLRFTKIGPMSSLWYGVGWPRGTRFAVVTDKE